MRFQFLREFIKLESFSGILLFLAALLGFAFVNSPFSNYYHLIFQTTTSFIINDGLMTFFFLLVGLEIKREMLVGELNSIRKAMLPGIAAIGGMIVPAVIYLICNYSHPEFLRGWAIPTATDIAFALGVLTLLGKRIPITLKIFLTALAIFDDLGAILIIAIFYSKHLAWHYLLASGFIVALLFICNYLRIKNIFFYSILGILLWICLYQAGIHPTIAGVLLAITIPLDKQQTPQKSLLYQMEQKLHPWVSYSILPLFAFANSGLALAGFHASLLFNNLPLGIILGLILGKQLGIFSAIFISVKSRWTSLPKDCNWIMFYGLSLLCGIGFTMSLFIGDLAFDNPELINLVRLGVFLGSLISGLSGYVVLRWCCKPKDKILLN